MNFKVFSLVLSTSFLFFSSCMDLNRDNQNATYQYPIPNIDSLITSQVIQLANKKVIKKAILGEQEEIINIKTDTTFWGTELEVFQNLEINKPFLVGAYEQFKIDESTILFERKEGEKNGVRQVTVSRTAQGALINISGTIVDDNLLYSSEQKLTLTFDEQTQLISSYSFSGFQKLITRDTVFFDISGTLRL